MFMWVTVRGARWSRCDPALVRAELSLLISGLRQNEWVIFEVKVREKRGLRRNSAFRGMGYWA